ncbi:hypothetical protein [Citrifermentans bremense]|uniref:hypothetical protein n=1 Tax=Citrifermentans bremense TaxID=60035 RepID=UPI00040B9413|nr:hypothetical protein [Citrifermentans bremense]
MATHKYPPIDDIHQYQRYEIRPVRQFRGEDGELVTEVCEEELATGWCLYGVRHAIEISEIAVALTGSVGHGEDKKTPGCSLYSANDDEAK